MVRYRGNGGLTGVKNTTTTASGGGFFARDEVYLDTLAGAFTNYVGFVPDPQFNLTTLLLHADSGNGANNNTFLDSSSNNLSITRNGTPTQGTFSPFSQTGWSNYFNGTTDYLTTNAAVGNLGTGDFTVECWVWLVSKPQLYPAIWSNYNSFTTGALSLFAGHQSATATNFHVAHNGTFPAITSSSTIQYNVWTHLVVERYNGTLTLYVNGVANGTYNSSTTNIATVGSNFYIMDTGDSISSGYVNGYISNFRVVKGSAVYRGTFTPSTSNLTTVTNTIFLGCQSNRFLDSGTNAYTITPAGTPSVQSFSPYAPAGPYGVSSVGGSAYFNGSTDYLSLSSSSKFDYSTYSTFTFECWFYPTSFSAIHTLFGSSSTSADGNTLFYVYTTGQIGFGRAGTNEITSSTGIVKLNTWNHIAFTGSSGTFYIYCNGAQVGGPSTTTVLTSGNKPFYIGGSNGYTTGYISNFRFSNIVKYSGSTYTVPTGPFNNDANVVLLNNGTNAGIFDSTAKNNFLTGSTATISTTQSKFGGSCMYFDGTSNAVVKNDVNTSGAVTFGTGDFTVECWFYPTTTPGSFSALVTSRTVTITNSFFLGMSGLTPIFYRDTAIITSGSAVTINTWNHIALCRSSGTTRLFVNGVSVGTPVSDSTSYTDVAVRLGYDISQGSFGFTGYMDDVRISKYARYPTATTFTPSATAFPNQ
jgi:Concanavalin A-like lectin/glucanases superfamily